MSKPTQTRDIFSLVTKVESMTVEECEIVKESLESFFERCREAEQGISTKESIRYRDVCDRIENETGRLISRWR